MTSPTVSSGVNDLDLTIMIPAYLEAESLRSLLPRIHHGRRGADAGLRDPHRRHAGGEGRHARGLRGRGRAPSSSARAATTTATPSAPGSPPRAAGTCSAWTPTAATIPVYFAPMWAKRDTWDITIGCRYAKGGQTENPRVLIFMSWVLNMTFRLTFNIKAKDVTNSFRLYRTDVVRPIQLESNAFDILEELLIKAVTHRPPATVGEVPVTFERRKAGESKRNLVEFAFKYISTLQRLRKFQAEAKRNL